MTKARTVIKAKDEGKQPEDPSVLERKRELAEQIGAEVSNIGTVALDIQLMRKRGILVFISVHGLSLLSILISWAELGIPAGDMRRKRLRRGRKDLFPEHTKKLRSQETRIRRWLEKHSFILEGFRPYRWIPFTAYEEWKAGWGRMKAEWNAVVRDMLDKYDEMVAQEKADMAEVAVEAWQALIARHEVKHPDGDEPVIVIGGREFGREGPDSFVEYVQERAIQRLPTKEELEAALYVDYHTALVLDSADLQAESLRRERLMTDQELERAKQAEAQAAQDAAQERKWAEREQARLDVEAHRKKLQAMHEAELEHARQQLESIVSPFQEAFEQLRAQMYTDVQEIAASIQENGYLHGRVADRARNLFDTFSLLNTTGDDELEVSLLELRASLKKHPAPEGGKEESYDLEAVRGQLRVIEMITHEAAEEVAIRAAAPTRARALEF